jgi:hypothetical protein
VFTPRLDHRRLLLRRPPMPAIIVLRPSVKTMSLRSATRQTADSDDIGRSFRADVGHLFRLMSAGHSD